MPARSDALKVIADLLEEQAVAFANRDLEAIQRVNGLFQAAVSDAMASIRSNPQAIDPRERRALRRAMVLHGELLGRASAANMRALQAIFGRGHTYEPSGTIDTKRRDGQVA
jgi:hypothetical protein